MSGGEGRRSIVIAIVSTVVFFALLGVLITHAPGWPEVRRTFFDWGQFKDSLPEISRAFLLNVKIFCIAEAFILVFALLLAVLRSLPGPAALPLRLLGIAYADFFRGVPTILVIAMLGFGAPALQIEWIPLSTTFWGIVALVLVYTAYVSEVYRAGIESVHPSQAAAARSLGLTHWQSLRTVVLPQAVRRVIPLSSTTSSACRRTPRSSASWGRWRRSSSRRSTPPRRSTTRRTWRRRCCSWH
jgi:polar amino acid transport system permease protein